MKQGSTVTYNVQFYNEVKPYFYASSLMHMISQCCVAFLVTTVKLCHFKRISPFCTITQPTGTSPARKPFLAIYSAIRMK